MVKITFVDSAFFFESAPGWAFSIATALDLSFFGFDTASVLEARCFPVAYQNLGLALALVLPFGL